MDWGTFFTACTVLLFHVSYEGVPDATAYVICATVVCFSAEA